MMTFVENSSNMRICYSFFFCCGGCYDVFGCTLNMFALRDNLATQVFVSE